jgi:hypothetical protein
MTGFGTTTSSLNVIIAVNSVVTKKITDSAPESAFNSVLQKA